MERQARLGKAGFGAAGWAWHGGLGPEGFVWAPVRLGKAGFGTAGGAQPGGVRQAWSGMDRRG